MVLLLLQDGSLVEVPLAVDVVHRLGEIDCVDSEGASIVTLDNKDVMAYTTSAETQGRWLQQWARK
jgi:hypothetical protein